MNLNFILICFLSTGYTIDLERSDVMNNILLILILASVGALIGWTTNVIAIKLLFRPLKAINILGFKIQGVIPKRRDEIAKSIGETVEKELLSVEELLDQILEKADLQDILELLKTKIIGLIEGKLPPFLSAFSGTIKKYIAEMIDQNGEQFLDEMAEALIHKATSSVSISQMVEEKIGLLELDEIERIILSIAKSELKHIEYLGGVLGFIIGITQGLIVILL